VMNTSFLEVARRMSRASAGTNDGRTRAKDASDCGATRNKLGELELTSASQSLLSGNLFAFILRGSHFTLVVRLLGNSVAYGSE